MKMGTERENEKNAKGCDRERGKEEEESGECKINEVGKTNTTAPLEENGKKKSKSH